MADEDDPGREPLEGAPAAEPGAEPLESAPAEASAPEPLVSVAIVDDQGTMKDCLTVFLNGQGCYTVRYTAASGEEFMQRYAHDEPTVLALVEVNMVPVNGAPLIQWYRTRWPQTLVLAISADRSPEATRLAVQAGAHGFFPKQAGADELLEALERLQRKGCYFNDALQREHMGGPEAAAKATPTPPLVLTPPERQVLEAVCASDEPSWEVVAERTNKALATVHTHRANLFAKAGTKSKAGLVSFGRTLGYGKGVFSV